MPAFIFSSGRTSYVIVDSWCRECYHMKLNFSNLKYELFKENVSNVQYLCLTGKLRNNLALIRQMVWNYVFHFFFHSTTEYLMLIDKNTLLRKISDVVIQLNSEKVIKVWNFSMPLSFCVKRYKFPGYTLGYDTKMSTC